MHHNIENISQDDIHRFASNTAVQKLIALIQTSDTTTLFNAEKCASNGDYRGAVSSLKDILSTPEAQNLIAQLGGCKDE